MPAEHVPRAFFCTLDLPAIPIFESLTTGATMQHIKRKELRFVKVHAPNCDPEAFGRHVEPILEGAQLKKMTVDWPKRVTPSYHA